MLLDNIVFRGGGGGGSPAPAQPPSPTRTPDTIRSKDTMEALLGISEGPILGLEDGLKSFFLGDTPLVNAQGEDNFSNYSLTVFPGQDVADPIQSKLGGIASSETVQVDLAYNVPVVRPTTTGQLDAIEIRILINNLYRSSDSGIFENTVQFDLEYKAESDGTWLPFVGNSATQTITAKTTSVVVFEYRRTVDRIDESYELRVKLKTNPNTTTEFADLHWESFQEVQIGDRVWNNLAVAQIVVESSDQFSSVPDLKGIYLGLLIKVPSNFDPDTRQYSGIWDGTFQTAWSDNPAWILYDFITNDRYGVNAYYSCSIDKYEVYEAAQWCDEFVSDGRGGTQPRYTFNEWITEPRSGKEMVRYLAGVFNATVFDDLNGTLILKVDKDETAVQMFTQENITADGFEYSYTDLNTRYNDISVAFKNPNLNNWATDRRRIYNQDDIDTRGRVPLDLIAVGCINDHEGVRRATYKLITSLTETEMVTFKTNRLGQYVMPFDIILVADPDMGYGESRRIQSLSASRDEITLRDPVYLESGISYVVNVQVSSEILAQAMVVPGSTGLVSVVPLQSALPADVVPDRAVISFEGDGVIGYPKPYRVLRVGEIDGDPDNVEITALEVNRLKWDAADNAEFVGEIEYSGLPDPFYVPGPIACQFKDVFVRSSKQYQLVVSPTFDNGAYKYYDTEFEVWSRIKGSGDGYVKRALVGRNTIVDHPVGLFEFKVLGKSFLGHKTSLDRAPVYEFETIDPYEPPADPEWIMINDREIRWGYANPPDDFEGFDVRYGSTNIWSLANKFSDGLLTTNYLSVAQWPATAEYIMVKAVDAFGVESTGQVAIARALGDRVPQNLVIKKEFHTLDFPGTWTNMSLDTGKLRTNGMGDLFYSGVGSAPIYDGGNVYETSYGSGSYEFTHEVTGNGRLFFNYVMSGNGYDFRQKKSGETIWKPMPEYMDVLLGDEYEFKIDVTGGGIPGYIEELTLYNDVIDIEEKLNDIEIDSDGTRLPIVNLYPTAITHVSLTLQDDGGDAIFAKVVDKNNTLGPFIRCYDSSGDPTSGVVDAIIKGY